MPIKVPYLLYNKLSEIVKIQDINSFHLSCHQRNDWVRFVWYSLLVLDFEITQIGARTTQLMIGEMRFQWWHDNLVKHQGSDHMILEAIGFLHQHGVLDINLLLEWLLYKEKLFLIQKSWQEHQWDKKYQDFSTLHDAYICDGLLWRFIAQGSLACSDIQNHAYTLGLAKGLLRIALYDKYVHQATSNANIVHEITQLQESVPSSYRSFGLLNLWYINEHMLNLYQQKNIPLQADMWSTEMLLTLKIRLKLWFNRKYHSQIFTGNH